MIAAASNPRPTGPAHRARVAASAALLGLAVLAAAGCGDKEPAEVLIDARRRGMATGARGDLQVIARAVMAQAAQAGDLPEAADIEELARQLEPTHLRRLPRQDPWGTAYEYEVLDGGRSFVVASAGPDREWGTDDDLELSEADAR